MTPWRVLVVEDDRVIAGLHCRFVAAVAGFEVCGVADTAARAERMIDALAPELLLLDLGLPDRDGLALLRGLRAQGKDLEAIAVTAASAAPLVRASMHLGIVDYVVKPFDQERLRQSLSVFARRMTMLSSATLEQAEVDRFCSDGPNAQRWLPRELTAARLEEIESSVAASDGAVTAVAIAQRLDISRVTARRYLEYLVTVGRARSDSLVQGPGRPAKTYELTGRGSTPSRSAQVSEPPGRRGATPTASADPRALP